MYHFLRIAYPPSIHMVEVGAFLFLQRDPGPSFVYGFLQALPLYMVFFASRVDISASIVARDKETINGPVWEKATTPDQERSCGLKWEIYHEEGRESWVDNPIGAHYMP